MAYNAEPGNVAYVVADTAVAHGAPAADGGFVGTAVKQTTPGADVARASRGTIGVGENYLLIIGGVIEVPNTNLSGIAKGALVYIRTTDNNIANASGTNYVVLGKVASLPGERGTPANAVRVNLDQKV